MVKDTKFSTDKQPERRGDQTKAGKANGKRGIMTEALMVALKREVDVIVEEGGKPVKTRRLALIAEKLAAKASDGDTQAIKEVFDRTEGKAAQAMILQGDEDKPIHVIERVIRKADG
jgi:hypothetical protein